MSELEEFKKIVSPIAYGLAYKSKLGTTEYQQLYAEEDVIKYFNNKPQLTIPKSIAEMIDKEIMADAVTKFAMFHEGFERFWLSYELQMYCAKKKDYALVSAYLAGKALGVDLVKVVEG
ncbi:hypothetical protein [Lactococcus lactis]|uniref:hypothetical protein n=1 Tax=Lactococcus lactis TaxID=1358 RepID=UPI00288DA208|nr:hypothetical protein [Lactococcus lactis]MDT2867138.1 hypothetical protein [Lactococcus lactis]MDT2895535.1 hypothetical protein [Lactococcus lactis]MDT2896257.1 hypothetical protein [Lactococcus lactis]MDT2948651.1 hypothetical protein [Lactococcus lactis]